MIFHYDNEDEYNKIFEGYCFDRCSKCDELLELSMEKIRIEVAGKFMEFSEIPMLKCEKCGEVYYTEYAKNIIYGLYLELCKRGQSGVSSKPNGFRKKYDYAVENNFIYDHRDYESIPGLNCDHEHSKEGFLTPVYFERKALLYFVSDTQYKVDIFSETYGVIAKKDISGVYSYEWEIPFGFNTNGKLIFWLGDLDSIDSFTRGILKNFNVESDHLLVKSEFYQGQMNCTFSNPIKEKQIITNKDIFINNIKEKYGIDLKHLDEECKEQYDNIKRPIVFNKESVSGVINAFDKILVEGINVDKLRVLYEKINYIDPKEKEHKKWKSIRLIKEILKKLCSDLSQEVDIEKLISPLYILHDYRIYLDHLLSEEEQEKKKQNIIKTLGVSDFKEQENIYYEEVNRLNILFQYLVVLSK